MVMKKFLAKAPPKLIDKKTAYGLLGLNLVVPGLGSIFARRIAGWFQLIISIAGFSLTLTNTIRLVFWYSKNFRVIQDTLELDAIVHQFTHYLMPILIGVCLFLISFFWSLLTSRAIIKEAEKSQGT